MDYVYTPHLMNLNSGIMFFTPFSREIWLLIKVSTNGGTFGSTKPNFPFIVNSL